MTRWLMVILTGWAGAAYAAAADWPQFRGPDGSGVSPETGLPIEWSKNQGIRWRAELPGRGPGSPVVVGDRVYVTCSSGYRDDRLHVLCFELTTGRRLWHRELRATGSTAAHPKSSMAAHTPVADETGVYALFASGDLAAFDPAGNLRWYRSLAGDYPTITNQVGMAASPVLAAGRLIVPMDNAGESFLAALDPKTGINLWKADRPRDINWTTPVIRPVGGRIEILFAAPSGLTAYDAETGSPRWSFKAGAASIPTGTHAGEFLYLPVGGVSKYRLTAAGLADPPEWVAKDLQTGYPSPLVYAGKVFAVSSQGLVGCVDARTGKLLYKERLKGAYSASPIGADGKVYCLNEQGLCTVLDAASDTFEPLAENDLNEPTLATPAIARGLIVIRTDRALYGIGK